MGTKEQIGRQIRSLREAKGLRVKDLADAVDMSPGYLSEVERGKSAISTEILARIARALGTTAGAIFGEEEGESESPTVQIPRALSEAAKQEGWSYRTTLLLLQGKLSLVARRSDKDETEWGVHEWIRFHNQVKDFIKD